LVIFSFASCVQLQTKHWLKKLTPEQIYIMDNEELKKYERFILDKENACKLFFGKFAVNVRDLKSNV